VFLFFVDFADLKLWQLRHPPKSCLLMQQYLYHPVQALEVMM
jgi:hypothetical protein